MKLMEGDALEGEITLCMDVFFYSFYYCNCHFLIDISQFKVGICYLIGFETYFLVLVIPLNFTRVNMASKNKNSCSQFNMKYKF